jgi:hypothetical protein
MPVDVINKKMSRKNDYNNLRLGKAQAGENFYGVCCVAERIYIHCKKFRHWCEV